MSFDGAHTILRNVPNKLGGKNILIGFEDCIDLDTIAYPEQSRRQKLIEK